MQRPKIGNAEGARSAGLFRYADGLWPNAAVLTYIVTAWCSAFPLAASGAMALNAAAVLAWVSALTLAAYMIHECVHNTIFASHAHNARLGRLLSWLVGACYTPFAAIADRHLVHHVARIDNVSFDYRVVLQRRPALATCIRSLEACYVPAVDIWMHFAALTAPFREQHLAHLRVRLLCVLAIRVLCFGLWAMWSLKAAICYAIAYVLFIHVLRFFDAFQHTYALHQLQSPHAPVAELRHSAEYEEANTYSNPLTIRWLPLNWLVLNFPFHNAHHRRPIEPWYRLPQVHVACFGALQQRTLNAGLLLRNYHRYRVARVLDDYGDPGHGLADPQRFAGALGVSFLTQY